MKILLIYPYFIEERVHREEVSVPPIGIYTVAAVLSEHRYDVEILNWHHLHQSSEEIKRTLLEKRPHVIGFSLLHGNRWGGIESYHLSGFGCGDANEVVKYVDRQIEQGEIAQGEVALSPGWRADYLQMVAEKIDQDIITDRNR